MARISEESLYRGELDRAKEDLARWRYLGKRTGKTENPDWQNTLEYRKSVLKGIRMLIKAARIADKARQLSSA